MTLSMTFDRVAWSAQPPVIGGHKTLCGEISGLAISLQHEHPVFFRKNFVIAFLLPLFP
jgi:hypothetical protein